MQMRDATRSSEVNLHSDRLLMKNLGYKCTQICMYVCFVISTVLLTNRNWMSWKTIVFVLFLFLSLHLFIFNFSISLPPLSLCLSHSHFFLFRLSLSFQGSENIIEPYNAAKILYYQVINESFCRFRIPLLCWACSVYLKMFSYLFFSILSFEKKTWDFGLNIHDVMSNALQLFAYFPQKQFVH